MVGISENPNILLLRW